MNVFPASPAAKGAQLRIKRLFSGQSLSLSTHFNASGGKKNISPGNLAQTPSGPNTAALRLIHFLNFPVLASEYFLTDLLPPTVRQPI